MPLQLVLPKDLPFAWCGVVANFLLCQLLAPTMVLPLKKKFMTPEFLGQFDAEHKEAFGENAKVDFLGLPDQGSGWYAKQFALKEWVEFNKV